MLCVGINIEPSTLVDLTFFQDKPSAHKKLAVLGCQLRKAEVSKKTYEVTTDKLLELAEVKTLFVKQSHSKVKSESNFKAIF